MAEIACSKSKLTIFGHKNGLPKDKNMVLDTIDFGKRDISGLLLPNNMIAVCGSNEIEIWDIRTDKLIRTLRNKHFCLTFTEACAEPHIGSLIRLPNGHLANHASISTDILKKDIASYIQVWNPLTGELIEWRATYEVQNLMVVGDSLVSMGWNEHIMFWDYKTGKMLRALRWIMTLGSHTKIVDNLLITEYGAGFAVHDMSTGERLRTFGDRGVSEDGLMDGYKAPRALVIHDGKIIYGCMDGIITVLEISTGEIVHEWQAHCPKHGDVISLIVVNDRLISASWCGTINVWDINTFELLKRTKIFDVRMFRGLVELDDKLLAFARKGKALVLGKDAICGFSSLVKAIR